MSITNSSDNNLSLLFDDQSDSSLNNNFSSFCSAIKPLNNMNSFFSGKNTKGEWGIRIRDKASGDIGKLYSWGIRFNNMTAPEFNFELTSLIQGFYTAESNALIPDTIFTYLREITAPYNIVSSSKAFCNATGLATFSFANLNYLQHCYLQVGHRNTIETWASNQVSLYEITQSYRFDVTETSVFGNNEIIVDSSPVRYGMYRGDVNQDDVIDLNDVLSIYNAAGIFSSGYVINDVNGDNTVDLNDVLIAYNNSAGFVAVLKLDSVTNYKLQIADINGQRDLINDGISFLLIYKYNNSLSPQSHSAGYICQEKNCHCGRLCGRKLVLDDHMDRWVLRRVFRRTFILMLKC